MGRVFIGLFVNYAFQINETLKSRLNRVNKIRPKLVFQELAKGNVQVIGKEF